MRARSARARTASSCMLCARKLVRTDLTHTQSTRRQRARTGSGRAPAASYLHTLHANANVNANVTAHAHAYAHAQLFYCWITIRLHAFIPLNSGFSTHN
eukprot:6187387-Pleurochrysis_carterae.AAC.1